MPEPGTNLTIDPQRQWAQIMETAQFGEMAKGEFGRLALALIAPGAPAPRSGPSVS